MFDGISYNKITGHLTDTSTGKRIGFVKLDRKGCRRRYVSIKGRKFQESRLIWFLVTGKWPTKLIDHKNRNATDNRWCNLRQATAGQNAFNRTKPKNTTSKYKGVYWDRQNQKWRAQIKYEGVNKYLGLFRTEEEAASAYRAEAAKVFGKFYCEG